MKSTVVLAVSTLLYMAVFIGGEWAWFAMGDFFIVALALHVCLVPLLFGYVTCKFLRPKSKGALLVILVIPIISDVASILSYKIQTAWAPRELATLVNSVMTMQALCVLLGAYVCFQSTREKRIPDA